MTYLLWYYLSKTYKLVIIETIQTNKIRVFICNNFKITAFNKCIHGIVHLHIAKYLFFFNFCPSVGRSVCLSVCSGQSVERMDRFWQDFSFRLALRHLLPAVSKVNNNSRELRRRTQLVIYNSDQSLAKDRLHTRK